MLTKGRVRDDGGMMDSVFLESETALESSSVKKSKLLIHVKKGQGPKLFVILI